MPETKSAYTLTFENRERYLYAYFNLEKADLPTVRDIWMKITAACRARSYKKVLVEQCVGERLSLADLYQFGTELPQIGEGLTGALVDQHPTPQEHLAFGELVARNRGVWGRVLPTVAEGEAWLSSLD